MCHTTKDEAIVLTLFLVALYASKYLMWLCRVAALKSLPVHLVNALIFPILMDCWHLHLSIENGFVSSKQI